MRRGVVQRIGAPDLALLVDDASGRVVWLHKLDCTGARLPHHHAHVAFRLLEDPGRPARAVLIEQEPAR